MADIPGEVVVRFTSMMVPVMLLALRSTPMAAQVTVEEWTLTVEWPAGATTVQLTASDSAGVRRVGWEGPQGTLPASDVAWSEERIAFVIAVEDQDRQTIRLRFEGRVEGDELHGQLTGPGGRMTVPVSGRRNSQE